MSRPGAAARRSAPTCTAARLRSLALAGLALAAAAAWSQNVALAGRMGTRALLVIDGQMHTLDVGASISGVRLLRWVGDDAEVSVGGSKTLLRAAGTPAHVGAAQSTTAAREIVIPAGLGGHFAPAGSINGKAVRFVVDTGATLVSMGRDEAQRLGLDLDRARAGVSQTANGPVAVQLITLDRVRVGEIEVTQVGAVVMPQSMPFILLGNSFLGRFQMRRDNDVMRLELR